MTRKLSILLLVLLITFSPVAYVSAQESDKEDVNESEEVEQESVEDDEPEVEEELGGSESDEESLEKSTDDDEMDEQEKDETSESINEEGKESPEEVSDKVIKKDSKDKENVHSSTLSSSVLKNGMRDERVVILKANLEKLGFQVPGNGTSYYGKDTEAKVREFQAYYGLTADGVAGPATFNKIDTILASPLQKGKRHSETVILKQNLAFVGFPVPGNGTTLFGAETEKKVKEFQKANGLAVNGIADEVTLLKLEEMVVPLLKKGIRHNDVIQLKRDLAKVGFPVPGDGTNYFGNETEKKVKEFQKYYGLSADGVAGEKTLSKLESVVNSPLQKGKRHNDTIQLKKDLATIGYKVPGSGTSLYGTDTEKVVKQFQKDHKLIVNGIADEVTLAKIQELQSGDLRKGMRHPDVVTLKEDLKKAGFPVPGNGTDYFGADTEKKVKEFQAYYGLFKSGVVDSTTSKKIDDVVNSSFQIGKRHPNTPQLKTDLALLGFPIPGDGTTYYGKETARQVTAFQKKHNLVQNGIADMVTLAKIQSLLPSNSTTLRYGQRDPLVITLKQNLKKIGFEVPGSGTNYYGKETERKVKEFQAYYGLGADGIAGKQTFTKISEILSTPLQEGVSHPDTIKLKRDLATLGYKVAGNGTSLYGANTAKKVREFQKDHGLIVNGIADEVTLNKIRQLLRTSVSERNYDITLDQALEIQKKASPKTDKRYDTYVSKSYISSKGEVTADVLNVREKPSSKGRIIGTLKKGNKVTIIGEKDGWYEIDFKKNETWNNASDADIKYYLDPNNFINSPTQMYQFLDLSKSSNASASTLNNFLSGKGVLSGKGAVFIEAGRNMGINEVYLISHSLLETGNGNSQLAKGVKYNGKTVYNMYGIGAYDSCPIDCGAKKAYEEGWFTVDAAIKGGAKFIGRDYINSRAKQNTLYKMRWSPGAMASTGTFGKQYATDIGWASKQTNMLYKIYNVLDSYDLHLEIPVYK